MAQALENVLEDRLGDLSPVGLVRRGGPERQQVPVPGSDAQARPVEDDEPSLVPVEHEVGRPEVAVRDVRIVPVNAPERPHDLPLDVRGTAFQEAVWRELTRIPPGETRSYAQIAAAVGNPNAVRAAGSANGDNNVAVLIPCHRVIRTGGDLGGYAYGLDIKRELLKREAK